MRIFNKNIDFESFIGKLALAGIGAFSILYSILWSGFSELHIKLSFLDFPIFVGEILLGFCIILLVIKWNIKKISFNKWHLLLALYAAWVLIKAISGYCTMGPLALRNAALFYYPFFAVITYNFYDNRYFSQKTIAFLLVLVLLGAKMTIFNNIGYFLFPYFAISLILIIKIRKKWIKYTFLIIIALLFRYGLFFHGSRSSILANIMALLFLACTSILSIFKVKKIHKLAFVLLVSLSLTASFFIVPEHQIKSLTTPTRIINEFKEQDKIIQKKKKYFKQEDNLDIQIYNPNQRDLLDKTLVKLGVKQEKRDSPSVKFRSISRDNLDIYVDDSVTGLEKKAETQIEKFVKKKNILSKKIDEKLIHSFIAQTQKILLRNRQRLVEIVSKAKQLDKDIDILGIMEFSTLDVCEDSKKQLSSKAEELYKNIVFSEDFSASDKDKLRKEIKYINKININNISMQRSKSMEPIRYIALRLMDSNQKLNLEYSNIMFRLFIWRDMIAELIEEKALFGFSFGRPQRSISLEIMRQARGEWSRDGWIAPHNGFLHIIYRAGIIGILLIAFIVGSVVYFTKEFMTQKSIAGLLLVSIIIYWLIVSFFLVVLELPHQAIPFWSLFGMTFAYSTHRKRQLSKG